MMNDDLPGLGRRFAHAIIIFGTVDSRQLCNLTTAEMAATRSSWFSLDVRTPVFQLNLNKGSPSAGDRIFKSQLFTRYAPGVRWWTLRALGSVTGVRKGWADLVLWCGGREWCMPGDFGPTERAAATSC